MYNTLSHLAPKAFSTHQAKLVVSWSQPTFNNNKFDLFTSQNIIRTLMCLELILNAFQIMFNFTFL